MLGRRDQPAGPACKEFTVDVANLKDIDGCHVVDQSFRRGFRTDDKVFRRAIEECRLIVCSDSRRNVIGYLRWGYFWDDELPYVQMIRIIEEFRRMGLGRCLIQHLETDLRKMGIRLLLSSTDETNQNSMGFHESLGFQVCGMLNLPGEPQEILLLKQL